MVGDSEEMLQLDSSNHLHTWTSKIYIQIRVILQEDKVQTLELQCNTNHKIQDLQEQIANIFGETKYSTSLFCKGKKLNAGERIADTHVGYTQAHLVAENQRFLLCLKGGEDAPKVFNRFTQVDSPERQLSYIADEEAYDAIKFIPKKDIKLAGFSVYQVFSNLEQDFKCLYKIRIGTESYPEKQQEFSQSDVENKMVEIMMPEEILVQKDKEINIAVRFISGEDFFCSTLLGYGGENYHQI